MHPTSAPLSPAKAERSNWEVLALLRFCLALIIALGHMRGMIPAPWFINAYVELGMFEAILGFLFISGYSIGSSIQREPDGYFRRRMFRIYPVYIAALLINFLVERNTIDLAFIGTLVVNLLFLGQVVLPRCYVDPAWSLTLEVWLYALAPLLLKLRGELLEKLIWGSFVCYSIYTVCRSLFHLPYYSGTLFGLNLPCLAFVWIAGFYLATTKHDKRRPLRIAGWLFLGHLVVTLLVQAASKFKRHDLHGFISGDVVDFLSHAILLFGVLLIFRAVIEHRLHVGMMARHVFRFLGDISYPLYLVHLAALRFLVHYTQNWILSLLAVLLLATLVYYACDFYSRRRKLA